MFKFVSLFFLFGFLTVNYSFGDTFTLIVSGDIDTPSSTARFSRDGVGSYTPDQILGFFANGDRFEVPTGMTLDLESNWGTAADLNLQISGNLNFGNGKLSVGPESTFVLTKTPEGSLTCTTGVCGNNDQLTIGATKYKGTQLNDINNADRPTLVTEDAISLPIVLGSFVYKIYKNNIVLDWETISEENFDFFSIERSEDGENFYEIGTVPGNGNSTERMKYSYVDANPVFGTSFYRLNAIDYDGSYEKFQSISIEYIPNELNVTLYPNPGNGKGMSINLGLPIEAKLKTVKIYNFSGDLVLHSELKVGKNNLHFERQLPKGLYYTKIQIDNFSLSKKLVIN